MLPTLLPPSDTLVRTHVPFFAHTLNLAVSEAIKADTKIHQLRKSCRDIVSFFHHSVKASEKLKEI